MESDDLTTELSDQDRVLLVFAYLGPLALVSLLATRREFVKWHAKQGIVLAVAIFALFFFVLKAAYLVFVRFFWSYFAEAYWVIVVTILTGALVLTLFCIVRALEGERFKIPMLGELADRI